MSVVLTGWSGTNYAKMAAHSMPVMERYALRHGHQFGAANLVGERPASWMKIEAIHSALRRFDAVLWVDVDVVVRDGGLWIGDVVKEDAWHALVEHETECGLVPNCGIWYLRQSMLPVLEHVWKQTQHMHHPWWEQAAVLELLGYAVTDKPASSFSAPTELHRRTQFLAAEWNHHPADRRKVAEPRFVHCTQYVDRLAEVITHASHAT